MPEKVENSKDMMYEMGYYEENKGISNKKI